MPSRQRKEEEREDFVVSFSLTAGKIGMVFTFFFFFDIHFWLARGWVCHVVVVVVVVSARGRESAES